jgi:hypothetical protein
MAAEEHLSFKHRILPLQQQNNRIEANAQQADQAHRHQQKQHRSLDSFFFSKLKN